MTYKGSKMGTCLACSREGKMAVVAVANLVRVRSEEAAART